MSGGGYDAPHIPPNYSRYDARRTSGQMSSNYDRPPHIPPRRRTPSPVGSSRRPYDSYVPPRSDVPFREPMGNNYRPNNYRPAEHSGGNYYSRSPSPDAYGYSNPPRMPDPDIWERGPVRRQPQEAPNAWHDRKNTPSSPTASVSGRVMRDGPSRLFEPSDTWKQFHHDRPSRNHPSPPSDRFYNRPNRNSTAISPERAPRNDRGIVFIPGGDRYRPAAFKRDSLPLGRNDYDSYRPQHGNWTPPFRRDSVNSINSTGSHYRKDSDSVHARSSDRYDSPFSNRAISRKTSPSIQPVTSPANPPSRPSLDTENESWSNPRPPARSEASTRAPSRSSIASTHVSDRKSPVTPSAIAPLVFVQTESSASDLSKNLATEKNSADKTAEGVTSEAKVAQNGSLGQTGKEPSINQESLPKPVSTITKQPPTILPTISNDVHAVKPSLNAPESVPKIPEITEKNNAVTPAKALTNGGPTSLPSPKEPASIVSSPPPLAAPPAAPNIPPSVSEPHNVLEIKQPKPSYTPNSVLSLSPMISPNDIHIPSPTHSPILTTPPPMDDSPPVVEQPIPRPDEIPPFTEAKTKDDVLRIVVMTRLLCDRQTKEERVAPVLAANLAISNPPEAHPIATPATLLEKMSIGQALRDRARSFARTQPLLVQYFEQRNDMLEDKVARLKEEYLDLQSKWVAHCNALNEQQKTLASEHENQHGGRTTRRTTAITDAVRSDFEMEQIIASLGVDEATDPNHLSMKNVATIPDMICVTKGQVDYVFDDTSKMIDHPKEYYAPHTGIHDWTDEEKQIFLDKFAAYPKQFGIIADFIPHKTAAQCVDFYYLHKKQTIDFRKVVSLFAPNKRKRRGMGKKKGNGLLVDIAKHDLEVKGANATASPSSSTPARRGRKPAAVSTEPRRTTSRRSAAVQFEDTPTSTPTPEPETRTRRRKGASNLTPSAPTSAAASSATPVVAATPASTAAPTPRSVSATPLPPAPTPASAPPTISAPVPTSAPAPPVVPVVQPTPIFPIPPEPEPPEPEIDTRPVKRAKRTRKIKSAAIVSDDHSSPGLDGDKELPPIGNEGMDSNSRGRREKAPSQANQWSEEDKNLFLSLLAQYGDDFKRIAASMPNKTTIMVTNFYKSNATALDLRKVAARAPKRSPTPEQHDVWKKLPFPGSGVISSVTTVKTGMPMSSTAPPMASLSADNGRGNPQLGLAYSRDSGVASPSRQQSRNPYPGMQPPMSIGHPYSDPHRGTYSPPTRGTTYPYPTDHRGIYLSARPPDGNSNHQSGPSSPNQSRPQFAPSYVSSSSPSLSSSNRPGYVPPPAVGSSAPSIVHSPTGMASPKPLPQVQPVQPMQSYPAHQSDPAHRSSYMGYAQTPPPVGTYWGPTPPSFYNPDGTTSSYVDPRHMPGPSDGTRRDHGYAMYPVGGPPGSHPPGYTMVPRSGPPNSAPGAARPAYYYPGWTS